MSYVKIWVRIVQATKRRQRTLTAGLRRELISHIKHNAKQEQIVLDCPQLKLGGGVCRWQWQYRVEYRRMVHPFHNLPLYLENLFLARRQVYAYWTPDLPFV